MFSSIGANLQETSFARIKTSLTSYYHNLDFFESDTLQSAWHKKVKENSVSEIDFMDSIFRFRTEVQNTLNDVLCMKTEPNFNNLVDINLYPSLINDIGTIFKATSLLKQAFECRFSADELEMWKKLFVLNEKKIGFFYYQLRIFVIESQVFDESLKGNGFEEMKWKFNEIRSAFKSIQNDISVMKATPRSNGQQMKKTFANVLATTTANNEHVKRMINELKEMAETHAYIWNAISNIVRDFLIELAKSKRQLSTEAELTALNEKLDDASKQPANAPRCFEHWPLMLKHNIDRIVKANTILKALKEESDYLKRIAEASTTADAVRDTHKNAGFNVLLFQSLFPRFLEHSQLFASNEMKFLTFIKQHLSTITPDQVKMITDSLEEIKTIEKKSHETIMNTLVEFQGGHMQEIKQDVRGLQANPGFLVRLSNKFQDLFYKLTLATKLNAELLDIQALAFDTICQKLNLK